MSQLRVFRLLSTEDLLAQAAAWDDLWLRSEVTIPTVQAACLVQWLRRFGEGTRFQAIVVEEQGRFVAALPLVNKSRVGLVTVGEMPFNAWTPAGELLLDPQVGAAAALDRLIGEWERLSCSWLWLDACVIDSPRWQQFLAACERAGLACDVQERFRIARTDLTNDWETYRQTWSRNHRRNMSRYRRQLEAEQGAVSLRLVQPMDDNELGALLRRGFEIEDRSWKGVAGTSVLRSPGMFAYFAQQAEILAQRQQLLLAFLDVGQQPIAFQYAWSTKGVYHPFKIGYDERFHTYSPGQLLIHDLLQHFHQTRSHQVFDFIGPISEASSKWQTGEYTIGRIVVTPRRMLNQTMMYAYQQLWPTLKRWRRGSNKSVAPVPSPRQEEPIGT